MKKIAENGWKAVKITKLGTCYSLYQAALIIGALKSQIVKVIISLVFVSLFFRKRFDMSACFVLTYDFQRLQKSVVFAFQKYFSCSYVPLNVLERIKWIITKNKNFRKSFDRR